MNRYQKINSIENEICFLEHNIKRNPEGKEYYQNEINKLVNELKEKYNVVSTYFSRRKNEISSSRT